MCDTSHQPFHVYSFAALGLLFVDLLHGGTIALGIIHGAYCTEEETRQLNAASGFAEICATMFHQQKSGYDKWCILLYTTTRNCWNKWRDHGWQIYEAIESQCRVPDGKGAGYSPILSVGNNPRQGMTTIWLK